MEKALALLITFHLAAPLELFVICFKLNELFELNCHGQNGICSEYSSALHALHPFVPQFPLFLIVYGMKLQLNIHAVYGFSSQNILIFVSAKLNKSLPLGLIF